MGQVISGEVAALFTRPDQAWEGGALMQAVASAEVGVGSVIDVASLRAIYDSQPVTADLRSLAVDRFAEQAMDAPLALPTRLAWLASGMGVHVVLNLGEEPVLPGLASGSAWGPADAGGKSTGPLYGVIANEFPGLPPHLVQDLPPKELYRPLGFFAYGAGKLAVGEPVRVLPL